MIVTPGKLTFPAGSFLQRVKESGLFPRMAQPGLIIFDPGPYRISRIPPQNLKHVSIRAVTPAQKWLSRPTWWGRFLRR